MLRCLSARVKGKTEVAQSWRAETAATHSIARSRLSTKMNLLFGALGRSELGWGVAEHSSQATGFWGHRWLSRPQGPLF